MQEKKHIKARKILEGLERDDLAPMVREAIQGWLTLNQDDEANVVLREVFDRKIESNHKPDAETYEALSESRRKLGFPQTIAKKRPLYRRPFFQAAAVLAIAVTTTVMLWVNKADEGNGVMPAQFAQITHTVEQAEPETVTMPDGSRINASHGATISYDEDFGNERSVFLSGEASFNVERDTVKVFTVNTEHFKIEVLGTEFKVKSPDGEDNSTIALYHGSILVEAGGQSRMMRPGDHLDYRHSTHEITMTRTAVADRVFDNMPNLVFENASLTDVLLTIEREYGIMMEIRDVIMDDNMQMRVDLSHAQTIDGVMSILARATGRFTYEITDDSVIVYPL